MDQVMTVTNEMNSYTTVKLDKELHKQLKLMSVQNGKDLQDFIEEIISDYLKEKEVAA
jgi:predicted DNA-binding protein